MIVDTHTHLLLTSQKDDIQKSIEEAKNNRVNKIIEIAVNLDYLEKAKKIANKYDEIYYTAWIHPTDAVEYGLEKLDSVMQKLEEKIKADKNCVWIWETWLDFYWLSKDPKIAPKEVEIQKAYFIAQIKLAKKLNKPLIIHNREAGFSVFEILYQEWYWNFVFHCYSEDWWYAQNVLKKFPEAMFSFTWTVTYKNAKEIQEVAKNIDINKIMVETDAPYLTPQKFRWQENFPKYTLHTLEFIAQLRWESLEKIEEQVYKNSIKFFNI